MSDPAPPADRLQRTGLATIAGVVWLTSFLIGLVVTAAYDSDYRQGLRFTLLLNAGLVAMFSSPIAARVPLAGRAFLERRDRLGEIPARALDEARPSALRTFVTISLPLALLAVIV